SGGVSVLLGDGRGRFAAARESSTGIAARTMVSGDFTGDGQVDLAILETDGEAVGIFAGNGKGDFTLIQSSRAGTRPHRAVAGDFTGDHKLDLAVVDDLGLWELIGDGKGGVAPPPRIERNPNLRAVAAAGGDRGGGLG